MLAWFQADPGRALHCLSLQQMPQNGPPRGTACKPRNRWPRTRLSASACFFLACFSSSRRCFCSPACSRFFSSAAFSATCGRPGSGAGLELRAEERGQGQWQQPRAAVPKRSSPPACGKRLGLTTSCGKPPASAPTQQQPLQPPGRRQGLLACSERSASASCSRRARAAPSSSLASWSRWYTCGDKRGTRRRGRMEEMGEQASGSLKW